MIKLRDIMPLENLEEFKIHVAKYNGEEEPLDVFIDDFNEWKSWHNWKGYNDRFSRKYIISFIDFYPQKGTFLFGGIFEVIERYEDHYTVKLLEKYENFIGRLKVLGIKSSRGSSFYLENYYDNIIVEELLTERYSTMAFPGHENIDYDFRVIEHIIKNKPLDWKGSLENIKGIYMLTDKINGKRYIGSAHGENGIWSRWSQYCNDGHGGNKKLIWLIKEKNIEYVKKNFKFTLLEVYSKSINDDYIIAREQYWKKVMMSLNSKFGYNDN